VCGLTALSACAPGASSLPAPGGAAASSGNALQTQAKGGAGGGGGGVAPAGGGAAAGGSVVGGLTVPPSTTDAASWFVSIPDPVTATCSSANIDFDCLQNTTKGGIPLATTRSTSVLIYNISKKTPLQVSSATFGGANASDFSISPAELQTLLATSVPANKRQAELVHVAFTPSASGVRTATLALVSNAGTALVTLTGTGLPDRPVMSLGSGTLTFIPTSAPDNLQIANLGGKSLSLNGISIIGANPASFQIDVANHGLSNCFEGELIGPLSFCNIAVGLAPGAPVPSTATFRIVTNDPLNPETDITLNLTP